LAFNEKASEKDRNKNPILYIPKIRPRVSLESDIHFFENLLDE
jgi:hypothetical protein